MFFLGKNIAVSATNPSCTLFLLCQQTLTLKEIEDVVAEIEKEKEAEAEKKRNRLAATQASHQAMLQSTETS